MPALNQQENDLSFCSQKGLKVNNRNWIWMQDLRGRNSIYENDPWLIHVYVAHLPLTAHQLTFIFQMPSLFLPTFPQWSQKGRKKTCKKKKSLQKSFIFVRDLSGYRPSQPKEGNSRERQRCSPAPSPGKCIFTNSLTLPSCLQTLANYPQEGESSMQEYFKRMRGEGVPRDKKYWL